MKIKLITLLTLTLVGNLVFAQSMQDYMSRIYQNSSSDTEVFTENKSKAVLIDESFEADEMPEGWTTYELAENGSWTLNLGLANFGEHSMKHAQVSAEADNWLVSPQVYIDADNYLLTFYEFSAQWELNSTNILISSGSGDPADGDFVEVLTVPATGWWIFQSIDLSAYDGESIYVGFQAISVAQAYSPQWWIDDVYLAPSEFTDGGIEITEPQGYSPDTGVEDVKIKIENHGSETISSYDVEWWVNGEQQTMYSGSSNIGSGSTLNVTIGEFDFDEEANYTIEAEIIITDDDDPSNNFSSVQYSVGLSNDLAILSMSPTGNSPFNASRDMAVEIINNGTSVIYDFDVEWEIAGVAKPNVEFTDMDLQPGESMYLVFEDNYFPDGIHTIWIGIPIDFDLTPEDNEIEDIYAVGGLYEDFQGRYIPDQWRTTYSLKSNWWPQNNDPANFYCETWAGANSMGVAIDTTWTPRLDISEGDELIFMANSGGGGSLILVWEDGETGEVNVLDEGIPLSYVTWDENIVDLSAAEGQNYIGFVNASGAWGVYNYDDITSTAPIFTFDYDLALFDQTLDQVMVTSSISTPGCRVKNVGGEEVLGTEYNVNLMNSQGSVLTSMPGVDLEEFGSWEFEFSYTFLNQGDYELFIEIDYASDENMDNNSGEVQNVHVAPEATQFPIIGSPDYPGLEFPFNTRGIADGYPYGKADFSQVLYYSDEIGTPGMIHGIKYFYKNVAVYGSVAPLQVWIAETDIEDFDGDTWYPQDDFETVFNDTVYTTGGDGYIYIQFDEPYFYDGTKNLILQHHCFDASFLFAVSDIWATVSDEHVRVNCFWDWHSFDLDDLPWPINTRTDYPHASFVIDPLDDIGVISGIIYDENNEPLIGTTITVEGTTIEVLTGADGYYELPPLSFGSLTIQADRFGYDYAAQTIDLNESSFLLDFYLELRPQVVVSGHVVGSNDNSIPLEGVYVVLDGYSYNPGATNEEGNFNVEDVYGNTLYQLKLELYGYETYIDTVTLDDVDLDLGTLVMQERFIPVVNVVAEDNDTEAMIEWINPGSSQPDYLINDMNEDMGGLANEPYEEVWMGNRFENSGLITLTDADIFFTFDDGGVPDSVQVDVFNEDGEVIASSTPFVTPWYEWVNLDLPNMTIDGDFFIMVHWKGLANTTHFLSYDYDWNLVMPNTAYLKYPGEDLILLGDYFEEYPSFSFWVRAHVLDGNEDESNKAALGYNIYRGLADDIYNVDEWMQLNTDPVTETNYTDDTWPPIGVNSYRYAVEALYDEADAEVTFSNNLDGGIVSVDELHAGVSLFPNPVQDMLQVQHVEHINDLILLNGMGQKIMHQTGIHSNTYEVDMSGQVPGVYYIRIQSDASVITSKFIKQ